jgi:hypothetical protein
LDYLSDEFIKVLSDFNNNKGKWKISSSSPNIKFSFGTIFCSNFIIIL